jgi:hypothetical protein
MELEIGKVYRFYKSIHDFLDLYITNETSECYWAKVIKKGSQNFGTPVGGIGRLTKEGKLFDEYEVSCMEDYVVEETPYDGVVKKQKRRTSSEIEVDKLIEHVQRNFQIDQLYKQIDEALANDDVELFVRLSKEYAKLKKKVSA